jgi:hypothetical protein
MFESKLKDMEKAFQLKMNLMEQQNEGNNDALQKEIKALKEKLARAQPEMEDTISSDLNYDTVCTLSKNDDDDINTTSKLTVTERNSDALQKEAASLKQKELDQKEENRLLKERLARIQDNVDTDLSYDSSDDEIDDENDINYDSEYSINEEAEDDCNATAKQNRTEGNDDDLQKELVALKQKELEQQEENQRLKERLARMEEAMQNNGDNDLNYDSSDNEHNDNNATNNVGAKKKDDYALQEERAALKQKELEQHEENQLLRERLARIVAVQDDRHNDPYYNSSDNKDGDKNDNTYNTKRSNGDKKKGGNNTTANTQQRESHYHSVEIYADPNYDSSDNEDPRNNIYLD